MKPLIIEKHYITSVSVLASYKITLATVLAGQTEARLRDYVNTHDDFFQTQEQLCWFESFQRRYDRCTGADVPLKRVDTFIDMNLQNEQYKNVFLTRLRDRLYDIQVKDNARKSDVVAMALLWYKILGVADKEVSMDETEVTDAINADLKSICQFVDIPVVETIQAVPYERISNVSSGESWSLPEVSISFPLSYKLIVNDTGSRISIEYGSHYPTILEPNDACLALYDSDDRICAVLGGRFNGVRAKSVYLHVDEDNTIRLYTQDFIDKKPLLPNDSCISFWTENGEDVAAINSRYELVIPPDSIIGYIPSLYRRFVKEKEKDEHLLAVLGPRCLLSDKRYYGDKDSWI